MCRQDINNFVSYSIKNNQNYFQYYQFNKQMLIYFKIIDLFIVTFPEVNDV